VDKALLTIPELMRSPPGFSGTLLAQFLLCLSFCLFYFGHCIHCKSALRYTASDYPLAIVSIVGLPFDIQILITLWPLYVCPSIYSFWLPLGHCIHCMSALRYTLLITLWPLYPLYVCPSIYSFWLPFGIFKVLWMIVCVVFFRRFMEYDKQDIIYKHYPGPCIQLEGAGNFVLHFLTYLMIICQMSQTSCITCKWRQHKSLSKNNALPYKLSRAVSITIILKD
jgi:hypothetical protein